jgi:signal transduction histidine kinase
MWAENNPDGKGATFTFTLPLEKRHPEDLER